MMSGKAVARALRGHFLVEAALVNNLMTTVIPCNQGGYEPSESNESGDIIARNSEIDPDSSSDINNMENEKPVRPSSETITIDMNTVIATPPAGGVEIDTHTDMGTET